MAWRRQVSTWPAWAGQGGGLGSGLGGSKAGSTHDMVKNAAGLALSVLRCIVLRGVSMQVHAGVHVVEECKQIVQQPAPTFALLAVSFMPPTASPTRALAPSSLSCGAASSWH